MLQNEKVNNVDWDDHATLHGRISWLAEVAEKKCMHFLRGTGYEKGLSPEELEQIQKSCNWLKAIKERHSALMQEYEKKAKSNTKPEPTVEDFS
jgi:ABC-type microcin C transport system permease subunit YejB